MKGCYICSAIQRYAADSSMHHDRDIMTGSRTARFNRNLLQEGKAFGANLVPAYPGDKHACTSLIYAIPATGVSLGQMEGLVRQQLDSLADKGPTASEMERIKKVRCIFWAALVQDNSRSGDG